MNDDDLSQSRPDLHPPDDYTHRFFIWHEWIQANGPLAPENVFDYFATSMFYDKQSNNQVLRMQTIYTGRPILNEAEELRRFTGIEFAVVHAQPPTFFIIHKRERLSPDKVRPLAAYFVLHNRIYQSPDLYSILSNRLLTAVHSLHASLDVLRRHRPDYTPRSGFVWPITLPDSRKLDPDTALSGTPDKPALPKRQQNDVLLLNAMRTTAAHLKLTSTPLTAEPADSATTAADTPLPPTRSSLTPAPLPTTSDSPIKGPSSTLPTDSKAPPSGAKKKKKRTSLAAPSLPT